MAKKVTFGRNIVHTVENYKKYNNNRALIVISDNGNHVPAISSESNNRCQKLRSEFHTNLSTQHFVNDSKAIYRPNKTSLSNSIRFKLQAPNDNSLKRSVVLVKRNQAYTYLSSSLENDLNLRIAPVSKMNSTVTDIKTNAATQGVDGLSVTDDLALKFANL